MTTSSYCYAAVSTALLLSACGPSDLGTAPTTPVDPRTNIVNTGAYGTDTGIKTPSLEKIDTGINPRATP